MLVGNGGIDTMVGGLGDDIYGVDNAADVVTENAGEGTDLVVSVVSYTIGANIENLSLAGGSMDGTGNALDNRIIGTPGNNAFNGMAGNDTMIGGLGNDTFTGGLGNDTINMGSGNNLVVFNNGDGQDTINGFISLQDTVRIVGEAGFTTFADIQTNAIQSGANLLIQLNGGDSLTFNNTTLASLHSSDFMFA
jgi:Ca2+-binding RTX toxin-like protein